MSQIDQPSATKDSREGGQSPSMRRKLAQMRKHAPLDVPKARLCSEAIFAAMSGHTDIEVQALVRKMRVEIGPNWSLVHALQFMSGRRGEYAAECSSPEERPKLFLAHLVAKAVCEGKDLDAVQQINTVEFERLKLITLG